MPSVDPKISLGSLIQIVLLLFTLGGLWASLTERQDQLAGRIKTVEERIHGELLRADVQRERDNLTFEKLRSIDARLERLERKMQP